MKKVGRPISKPGRVKVGFSVSGECAKTLNKLAEERGVSKSEIAQQALKLYDANLKVQEEVLKELNLN